MTRSSGAFDSRLTAARPDLAAASLRGKLDAPRFVDGERFTVSAEVADMKRAPRPDAPLDTQLLHGQTLVVYDDEEGWGWAQSDHDGYVGYVAMSALVRDAVTPTHRVAVARTFVYPAADMKQPVSATIPLGGQIRVEGTRGDFLEIRGHGFVYARHVVPIGEHVADPVSTAELLLGTPYLWGGASPLGIDCSGLVQLSWSTAGRALPRDTDMQEPLGEALPLTDDLGGLERGDLVFWRGHVGIMTDADHVIHANAYHMLVAREALRDVDRRVLSTTGLPISSLRRIAKM